MTRVAATAPAQFCIAVLVDRHVPPFRNEICCVDPFDNGTTFNEVARLQQFPAIQGHLTLFAAPQDFSSSALSMRGIGSLQGLGGRHGSGNPLLDPEAR